MAILTSATLISSLSIFNLICAYSLLTMPAAVSNHNLITVLAASVNLPVGTFKATEDAVGLLAAVLALVAVSDISAASMKTEIAAYYWQVQVPIRLTFFFALTAYSYSFRPGGLWAGRDESLHLSATAKVTRGGLGSGIVFAWAFLQTCWWFWVYLTLRDEKSQRQVIDARRHAD